MQRAREAVGQEETSEVLLIRRREVGSGSCCV